jgi:CheY-like chemotaxis protein
MLRVLLVEDNPGDARLMQEVLSEGSPTSSHLPQIELEVATSLAQACSRLTDEVDAVLLDLNLPDSNGLETFARAREAAPRVPFVILSGLEDQNVALTAVQQGAQDYLVKGKVSPDLVQRSLRYAIARHQAESEAAHRREAEIALETARQAEATRRERQEREVSTYERYTSGAAAPVSAGSYGTTALRGALPETFARLVERYRELLDLALDQRAYRVDHRLSDGLRSLADEIGFLNGGPRDVVELHTAALRVRIANATSQRAQAYVDEARILVLELMGHLVAYYRR